MIRRVCKGPFRNHPWAAFRAEINVIREVFGHAVETHVPLSPNLLITSITSEASEEEEVSYMSGTASEGRRHTDATH
jgi:hypothetical protein